MCLVFLGILKFGNAMQGQANTPIDLFILTCRCMSWQSSSTLNVFQTLSSLPLFPALRIRGIRANDTSPKKITDLQMIQAPHIYVWERENLHDLYKKNSFTKTED